MELLFFITKYSTEPQALSVNREKTNFSECMQIVFSKNKKVVKTLNEIPKQHTETTQTITKSKNQFKET